MSGTAAPRQNRGGIPLLTNRQQCRRRANGSNACSSFYAGSSVFWARSNTKKEKEELSNSSGRNEINTRVVIGQVRDLFSESNFASDNIVAPNRSVSAK